MATQTLRLTEPTDRPVLVDAVGISKRFGSTQALHDVSIQIRSGEIHALLGRNGAGKSTLVAALTGLIDIDSGDLSFDRRPAPAPSDRNAWRRLAACVYQYPTVVPQLSVAENLFLGNLPAGRAGKVNWPRIRERAVETLGEWNLDIDVDAPAGELSVDQRQIVEISRALLLGTRFIILDEPTAGLTASEVSALLERIRLLNESGVAFLYITHFIEEIFGLCDRASFLRDGQRVTTTEVAGLTLASVVEIMVGERATSEASAITPDGQAASTGAPVLEVNELEVVPGCPISFKVSTGEIVGLAGAPGSSNMELADRLAGLAGDHGGKALILGHQLTRDTPATNIDRGLGYLPGDRYTRGMVPALTVADNISLPILRRLGRYGFAGTGRREAAANRNINAIELARSALRLQISQLSGGNQQKATLARALAARPRVLVLARPTAGIDIAAKQAILAAIRRLSREEGTAVLVVSDDAVDLGICDRVLVMFKGRVTAEFVPGWQERQLVSAMEGMTNDYDN